MKQSTKKRLNIASRAIGVLSFVIIVGFFGYALISAPKEVTVDQVHQELVKDDTEAPKDVVVRAKIRAISEVPLYGYQYDVGDGIRIVNFDKLPYKVGDEVVFRIIGVFKLSDIYIINVDFQ